MSDPALIRDPTIIEAAIDAAIHWTPSPYEIDTEDRRAYGALVDEILKVVTPLIEAAYVRSRATIHVAAIRAAALEEAARVAEEASSGQTWTRNNIALRIRALKPASPSPSADSA